MKNFRMLKNLDVAGCVSLVTPRDEEIYQKFADDGTVCYGNSWHYHRQAARNGWYKYYDGETLITMTTRGKGKYPYVLVRPMGKDAIEKTYILAKTLGERTGEKVIVKKIDEKQKHEFLRMGFEDYRDGDGWHQDYRYDDDTFPESVIDLVAMVAKTSREYRNLRRHLNQFERDHTCKIVRYDPKMHFADVSQLLKTWASEFVRRHPEETEDSLIESHMPYLHDIPRGERGRDYFAFLFYIDERPVAFSFAAKISRTTVGLFANVCDNSFPGLADAVVYRTFEKAQAAGFRFANFGGCESETLHTFRSRFKPSMRHKCSHVVLYPGRA